MLRTWAYGEGGQIVSFLTRESGKMRGLARSSRRMKSKFGAALEPFSRAQVVYFQKEGRELVTLDHADLLASPWIRGAEDLEVAWHLQYLSEVVEQVAREGEPEPVLFRLLSALVDAVRQGLDVRLVACYFELWLLRIEGVLPDLARCGGCGEELRGPAVLDAPTDALVCGVCAPDPLDRPILAEADRRFLLEALRRPVAELAEAQVPSRMVAGASVALRLLLQRYIGRQLRSLRFLDSLESLPR